MIAEGGRHTADMSSGGSMSVCTTSGMRTSEAFNRKRLFVVCHKGATEDMLARLFRMWPDLEYLDLKHDHTTGERFHFCSLPPLLHHLNLFHARRRPFQALDTSH